MLFDGVFLSIYSHLLNKLDLSKLYRKKGNGALKIPKMACSKLVKYILFSFLNLPGRYLIIYLLRNILFILCCYVIKF